MTFLRSAHKRHACIESLRETMKHTSIVRYLAFVLLALLIVSGLSHAEGESEECAPVEGGEEGECANPAVEIETPAVEEDPNCPSRERVIRCAGIHLDTNQNGFLERAELQSAIDRLPWYSRGIISILGSVDKMMKKCKHWQRKKGFGCQSAHFASDFLFQVTSTETMPSGKFEI